LKRSHDRTGADFGGKSRRTNMPGMQMHEAAKIQSAGTPGRYRAKIKVQMAGDWNAQLSYDGPHGHGETTITLGVK
jgi:hypothetical protein